MGKGIISLLAIAVFVIAASSHGMEAPPDGRSLSQTDIELQREIHAINANSGIARRLKDIKLEREQAAANGIALKPVVVNAITPVIMGSFPDDAHSFTSADFQTLLFGTNPTGNMTDYYDEVSYGQFNLTGNVFGPFTADSAKAYYGSVNNGKHTNFPANVGGFIWSILDDADAVVDFTQYDNDGPDGLPNSGDDDGFVDVLTVVSAGGQPGKGDVNNFRAHAWSLKGAGAGNYTTTDPRTGGGFIKINSYTIQPAELGDGTLDVIQPIGVFVHEYGHKLALPDQYDSDGSTAGVGRWCLMGSGTKGVDEQLTTGHRPTHLCAWCKVKAGWVVPTVVSGTETVQIPPVETNPVVYKLWDDAYQGGRYFLLENRTRTGFDGDLPGEGVLVWHCNDEIGWDNSVDNYRLVDLEEADGLNELDTWTSTIDDGDPFPGSSGNTSFSDLTNPSATDVNGSPTGLTAENFAYVAGPGSDVSVTLTQRPISGYTLSYYGHRTFAGFGNSTPTLRFGAVRYSASSPGTLVGLLAAQWKNNPVPYTVRVFDDIVGGAPVGIHTASKTSGMFPDFPNDRHHDITLASPLSLSAGQTFVIDVAWGPDKFAVRMTKNKQGTVSNQSFFSTNGTNYTPWTDKDVLIQARIQTSCCVASTGNVDNDPGDIVDIADLTFLIDHLFINFPPLACPEEGNVDGDPNGVVDIADLTFLIDHLFINFPPTALCGTAGPTAPKERKAPSPTIESSWHDGKTTIKLKSAEPLRGLQLNLVGTGNSNPVNLLSNKLDLFSGRRGDALTIGIVDSDGPEVIPSGQTTLLQIEGQYEIESSVASDLNHNTVPLDVNSESPGLTPRHFSLSELSQPVQPDDRDFIHTANGVARVS